MSSHERERMVEEQLVSRGVRDARVLAAMREVPRSRFVPEPSLAAAYQDRALPLGEGQTVSQPFMVARTLELARIGEEARVLDVGTGSGYQAAVVARLAREVIGIERIATLALRAQERLREYTNVRVVVGDGTLGYPDKAPYDAIVCAAAAPYIPPSWKTQLAVGGRAVLPIGTRSVQHLTVVERVGEERWESARHEACVYVPLVGQQGWAALS